MAESESYPLEQLAIIKQKKLEDAERVLEEKKRLLAKEEEKLVQVVKERDEVKAHKDDKLAQLRETLDQGSTSDKIQQMKAYLKVVDEQLHQKQMKVKEQEKQVELAKAQVEEARKEYFKRQLNVEKLRLHRKEWEAEMKVIEEGKEAIQTDEIGSAMDSLRRRQKKAQKE
jgi:flagellar biosynthesis chaperone FliJ